MKEKKTIIIACPKCRKTNYLTTKYKPFCSQRCKIQDLSKWSDGSYSITETTTT